MITAVVWGYKMRPTDKPCASIEYIIEDRAERLYVTEAELEQVLREEHINPVGQPIDMLSLYRIEKAILRHPMVRTAECYITPRYEVKVRLTQRVPLLRVQTPSETYFVDADRRVMQARAAVRDSVIVVTGNVGVQMATNSLADFAEWLQNNRYWRHRIRLLYVQNPQMVFLKVEGLKLKVERIVLGSMKGYEQKLAKLRTFCENGVEATQEKQY